MTHQFSSQHTAILEAYKEQKQSLGGSLHKFLIEPIISGGSSKKVNRIKTTDQTSYIVLEMPWQSDYSCGLDYFRIGTFIAQCEVLVPQILATDETSGYVLIEDLGDVRLLDALYTAGNDQIRVSLYQPVTMQLAKIQSQSDVKLNEFKLICKRTYDITRFQYEIEIFFEQFFVKHLQLKVANSWKRNLDEEMHRVYQIIMDSPQGIVLKDVHSRNLMTHGQAVYFIDYQDALIGPSYYDLASLIYDQFFHINDRLREQLIDQYLDHMKIQKEDQRLHARKTIDYLALHRCMKGIGSYSSFESRRAETKYLRFIGVFWNYIGHICQMHKELAPLYQTLQVLYHSK